MTTRPSRSSSIPMPGSATAARNIENIISIPFNTTPTAHPRLVSSTRMQVAHSPERSTTIGRANVSTSPVRSLSGGYAAALGRSVSYPAAVPAFEPRIIRAAASPTRPVDPACYPTPTSPTRTRRPSAARTPGTATPAVVAPRPPSAAVAPQTTSVTQVHSFPRPAYLEHSALRDLLYTDPPTTGSSARASEVPITAIHAFGPPGTRSSTPVPVQGLLSYPYLRREQTPSVDDDDESAMSPPPPSIPVPPTTPAVGALLANPVLRLPTRWSEQDRSPTLSVSADGRELTFYGPSCIGDRDSCAARANYPIPPACGIYYYEVEILQKGTKGHISIGFASGEVRLSRLPGWEKYSWGYHADDGWAFPGHKDGNPYGPTFDTGDIIGCGVDFSQNRAFYTKNGSFLGMVFENVGKGVDIYPSVGLRHTSESIRVNFGHAPFKYAIEDHVHAQRNTIWSGIQSTPIDWNLLRGQEKTTPQGEDAKPAAAKTSALEEQVNIPIRKLVLSYLAHHGYAKTARAFQAQCEGKSSADAMDTDDSNRASSSSLTLDSELDLRSRIEIVNAVLKGDVDSAIAQTRAYHPTVLEREQGLILFKLRCRKFVELILDASEALKRVQAEEQERKVREKEEREREILEMDGSGAMEVDDLSLEAHPTTSDPSLVGAVSPAVTRGDITTSHSHLHSTTATSSTSSPSPTSTTITTGLTTARQSPVRVTSSSDIARIALNTAIEYGQMLENDYKHDGRPEVRTHLKRTFGVVAYADPLAAGGEVAEMAGQEARAALANELNQAILESQGKPAHPVLETMYRQTAACVLQLGLLGVGSAAFADMPKEFLDA